MDKNDLANIDKKELAKLIALYPESVPLAVGRATIAWNNVSYSVYRLFEILSGLDPPVAKSVFFVVKSDRSQRDMVSELIRTKLQSQDSKLAKKIQSLVADVNTIAGKRNDVLHVVFLDSDKPSQVSAFHEIGHLKGKKGAELTGSIHKLTIECLDLSIEILKACNEINYPHKQLVEALLKSSAQQPFAKEANQMGFGLLNFPATTPRSSEEDQE